MKIAVAGFQHETNTFSLKKTNLADFQESDNWPGLLSGQEILQIMRDQNIPMSGFLAEARKLGAIIKPLTWCSAPPAGKVTSKAYNTVTKQIIDQIKQLNQPIDAIYLDLHGAMVCEHIDDADGHFIQQIRNCIGDKPWLIASLDLHANISRRLFRHSDLLIGYQTYPHVDMAETGQKAMRLLHKLSQKNVKPHKKIHKFKFLIPMTAQCTIIEPLKTIYLSIREIEKNNQASLSFTPGFPLADTEHTSPTLVSYNLEEQTCETTHQKIKLLIQRLKPNFNTQYIHDKHISNLIKQTNSYPLILADTQDNPGCGGSGDTTGILRQLLKLEMPCLVANIHDPKTVAQAFKARINDKIELHLGENSSQSGYAPLNVMATVLFKTTKNCIGTGPFYKGCLINLGHIVRLRINNVEVIVTEKNIQVADMSMIEITGIHPSQFNVVALKSSVHFRAAFHQFSDNTHIVISPGLNTAKLTNLTYCKLPKDIEVPS